MGKIGYISILIVFGLALLNIIPDTDADSSVQSGWGMPENIEFDEQNSGAYPVVDMDRHGNAHAVWVQSDGTYFRTLACRYIVGYGWTTPVVISSFNGNANFPKVVSDDQGNALAVWLQGTSTYTSIYSCYFKAGEGWGLDEAVETGDDGNAGNPSIAMDASGNAIAVWHQNDGLTNNIYSNIYTPGTGWASAELIATDNSGQAYSPQIAMNPSGEAIATWRESDGIEMNAMANIYLPGTGWGSETIIDSGTSSVNVPYPAIDSDGNAVTVWQQSDGTNQQLFANRFTPGLGWGIDGIISDTTLNTVQYPQVEYLGSGDMIAAWAQYDGTRYNLYYSIGSSSGWTTAVLAEDVDEPIWEPEMVADGLGKARMIWTQYEGNFMSAASARYSTGEGWVDHQILEQNPGGVQAPEIAISSNGDAIGVWYQSDGVFFDIWANRYVAPDMEPPVLSLMSPQEDLVVDLPMVTVNGTTEPGAHVVVNGLVVDSGDGTFSVDLYLMSGINTITVTSTDPSGNTAMATRNVEYIDPIIALKEEVLSISSDLANISTQLSSLEGEALWENITSISSMLNSTAQDIENFKTILEGFDPNSSAMDILQGMLDALEETLNSTNSEIVAIYEELEQQQDSMDSLDDQVDALEAWSGEEEDDDSDLAETLVWIELVMIILLSIFVVWIFISTRNRTSDDIEDLE